MNDCTMDEWVLRSIRGGACGDIYHYCVSFIEAFLLEKKCQLCVDGKGTIVGWYENIANKNRGPSDIVKRWWESVQIKGKLKYVKPRITNAMKGKLKKMKFHDDDYIWVEVANVSISKRIVSGDSDFGCNPNSPKKNREDVRDYLKKHGILAMPPQEALRLFQETQT